MILPLRSRCVRLLVTFVVFAGFALVVAGAAWADEQPPPWTPQPKPTPAVATPDDTSASAVGATGETEEGSLTGTLIVAGCVVAGVSAASVYAVRRSAGRPPTEDDR